MIKKTVLFFGSFLHYSTKVLEALVKSAMVDVVGVVTTPPMPAGRDKKLTKTHTHEWAQANGLKVFAPQKLDVKSRSYVLQNIGMKPDFMVTAGYGKLIPASWLTLPKISPINLHFSLLPAYRGANPAEWALLMGEDETGVTMIVMDEEFDTGRIITRKQIPILFNDNRETLYDKLYDEAGTMAAEILPHVENTDFATPQQEILNEFYAYRMKRSDGFIDWRFIRAAMEGVGLVEPTKYLSTALARAWRFLSEKENQTYHTPAYFVERSVRALYGYPGVWTTIETRNQKPETRNKKRMKILEVEVENGKLKLEKVQIEGLKPSRWNEVKNQVLT